MSDHRQGNDLNLANAIGLIRRRWLVILICVSVAPLSALGFSLSQEKQYAASASLLFRDPGLDQKVFGSTVLEPSTDPVRESATNVRLVSLEVVAARTARELRGNLSPGEISAKVDVAAEGQADVISVTAEDPSRSFAARLANEFAEQYIAFRRGADRAKVREAQQLVQRQLANLLPQAQSGPEGRSLQERVEELGILAALQTGNAELVQRAQPPTSASSPKTRRNVILGAVAGLLLALGLALLLERLDRRLRDSREIEQTFRRPILGAIPTSNVLAKTGASRDRALPPNEEEAFRLLRANLRYFNVDRPIKSVLVTSAAPGDGKSTVSWNLASAVAGVGQRVLLIEADLRQPSLAASGGDLRPEPGLSAVLAGANGIEDVIQQVAVPQPTEGAPAQTMGVVVAGALPPNPVDLIESDRMRDLLVTACADYDLVILDTPPTSVVSDAIPLVRQVDGVIVVGRLGRSRRESMLHLRDQLENLDAPTLGVVVNGFRIETGAYGYGYGYGSKQAPPRDDAWGSGQSTTNPHEPTSRPPT